MENIGRSWVRSTLSTHRKKGFLVTITNNELYHFYLKAIKNPCPYCGRKMEHGKSKCIDRSPSLDIINPHKKEVSIFNIQIICHQCNTTKNKRSHREFLKYCESIIKKFN